MKKLLMKKINFIVLLTVCCTVLVVFCCGFTAGPAASAKTVSDILSASKEIQYGVKSSTTVQAKSVLISETISYSRIETEQVYINTFYPQYCNTNDNLTNVCAPVAGTMLIGYYDRFYTGLIPNFTPGYLVGSSYYYQAMTDSVQSSIDWNYTSMSTNNPLPGTTQTQYKNGLTAYVNSKSLNISYTSIASGGAINYNTGSSSLVSQIAAGRPISVFSCGFNLCSISDSGSSITLSKNCYDNNHILEAYAYRRIKYFDSSNNNFRTDLFLRVSSGLNSNTCGWYLVGNSGTTLVDAETAFIY